MPTKQELNDYLQAVLLWVKQLKEHIEAQDEESSGPGSNPPPPPPPPPAP